MGLLDLLAEDYTPRYRNNHRLPEGERLVVRLRPMTAEQGAQWQQVEGEVLELMQAGKLAEAGGRRRVGLAGLLPQIGAKMSTCEVGDLLALPMLCTELLNRSISGPEPVHTARELEKGAKVREQEEAGSGIAWLAHQLAEAMERAEGNG